MVETFSEDYLSLLETSWNTLNSFEEPLKPTNIVISTITMIADLKTEISINSFKECPTWTPEAISHNFEIGVPNSKNKVKRTFFNQISVRYKDEKSQKSIKIFSNGRLQMTGITSSFEARNIVRIISECLTINPATCVISKDINPNLQIAMINSNFCLNYGINVVKLQDIMSCSSDRPSSVIYEPDVYPGLKVKYNNTHMFVFSTGNIVITGAKSIKDIQNCYIYVNTLLLNNWRDVRCSYHTKKHQPKKISHVHGYPAHLYDACIRP